MKRMSSRVPPVGADVPKAALQRPHSKRCRAASDASGRAERLECGRFSAAFSRVCGLMILFAVSGVMPAAPPATHPAAAQRVLVIEPSSMPVAAGTATLIIGSLQRTGDIYGGAYQMKVSPYFFKNEKGRLAIVVPEEALAKISQGQVATVIGTATTSGEAGQARHVDAIATPTSKKQGTLKLWFMAGDRKMIFEPSYHFAEAGPAAMLAPTTETNLASHLKIHGPASPREVLTADAQRP